MALDIIDSIDGHQLVREARKNLLASTKGIPGPWWVLPQDFEGSSEKLLPYQEYDFRITYWCEQLSLVFYKLEDIMDMARRNIYKKKHEDKGELLKNWSLYNYEFFTLFYQSVLDVSLLLVNEVFDLGIPYRECAFRTIHSNRHIKGTEVLRILTELDRLTNERRQMKNLLLHRGQRIKLPFGEGSRLSESDIANIATNLGKDIKYTRRLLREFFAEQDRKKLLPIMRSDCQKLGKQICCLFDALLAYYRNKRQSFL